MKDLGFKESEIEAIEEGKYADVLTSWEENREKVFLAKHKKAIEDAAKEEVQVAAKAAAENSLKQKLKSRHNLEIGNVKELKFDDVLEALDKAVEASSKATDESLKAKVADLTTKVTQLSKEADDARQALEEKAKEVDTFKETHAKQVKRDQYIDKLLDGVVWAFDDANRIAREKRIIKKELEAFKIEEDETGKMRLLNPDGTPVLASDNKRVYGDPDEYVNTYVDEYKLRKVSGGGGGGGNDKPGGGAGGGKEKIDYSNIDALAERMGISREEAAKVAGV